MWRRFDGSSTGHNSSPVHPGSGDGGVYALRVADTPPVKRAVFFDSTYLSISSIGDARSVRVTEAGKPWGQSAKWHSAWAISPSGVSEVLGLDDWGLAASWATSYGRPPGTGFVRVDFSDLLGAFLAAEYRPAR